MKPVVVDTDVVSFLFKSDSRSHVYLPHLEDRRWLISFMTQAELEQWRCCRIGDTHEHTGSVCLSRDL
jgi:tRNA(fMet)-specific endonuclease VapC